MPRGRLCHLQQSAYGDDHGLEPRRRKLETNQGQDQREWGQLTDDDLQQVNGKREQLEGKIQERYGIAKDRARQDIDDWLKTMDRHSAM